MTHANGELADDSSRLPSLSSKRIMIVDDNPHHSDLVAMTLQAVECCTRIIQNPLEAQQAARDWLPDAIILDIMMPQLQGTALAKRLIADGCTAELLFLTSSKEYQIQGKALEFADQYINKPFEPQDLILRLRKVLQRQSRAHAEAAVAVGKKPEIDDFNSNVLLPDGREIHLTSTAMKLLRALLDGNGNVVTNEDLIKAVWGSNIGRVPSLYAYIRRLRQKIEITPSLPELIITHASVGYCYILKP